MTDKEKLEWWKFMALMFGLTLALMTVLVASLGFGVATLGFWVWPTAVILALIFRNVFLAGKRAGTKDDS